MGANGAPCTPAECRRVVGEIQASAEAENREKGRQPMGVAAILAQDPHTKPASADRIPALFVHVTDDSTTIEFRVRYRAFVDAFRAGAQRLRDRAHGWRTCFPCGPSRPPCRSTPRSDRVASRRHRTSSQAAKAKLCPTSAIDRQFAALPHRLPCWPAPRTIGFSQSGPSQASLPTRSRWIAGTVFLRSQKPLEPPSVASVSMDSEFAQVVYFAPALS